ncbi:MAG: hypothetical protein M3Y81_21300, partial [Chloroflexota bacterium]|nr:hypothetical protein [Chloroflexota bacterium]
YVSGTTQGISVIDVGQARVTKVIALAGDPHTILLSQDGRFLYMTQPALDQVSVIDAKTGRPACRVHLAGAPALLALDPNSGVLYTGGGSAAGVSALDTSTCAVRHTFQTASPVYGLVLALPVANLPSDKNAQLWVAGTAGLTIFDTHTGQSLGTVAVPAGPQYLTVPLGTMIYVTTRQGSIDAVNIQTRAVQLLLSGGIFGPMDYDALTGEVYVPDQQHSQLDVLSPLNDGTGTPPKEPERVIRTGTPPEAAAITVDGLLGFVVLQGGKVAMLDLIRRIVVYTVQVGGTPHFVITGLYPPNAIVAPHPSPPQQTANPRSGLILNIVIYGCALLLIAVLIIMLLRLRRQRPGAGSYKPPSRVQ